MNTIRRKMFILMSVAGALLATGSATAQQTTGTPGSPEATTTIDGRYLPPPPAPFQGQINLNAMQSKPAWPARVVPPKGAPNVLLILLDDAGYGSNSTFGGVIPTPTLDKIAANGLRYTNFHSTSLCSPTRAALLTGRNHHSVGFGVISEMATGFPGYDSVMGPENATVAKILKENGYRTAWYGKNHNTRRSRPARPARSLSGRPAWVSMISMGSTPVTAASGNRCSPATPRRSRPSSAIPGGTSRPRWPTRPSAG